MTQSWVKLVTDTNSQTVTTDSAKVADTLVAACLAAASNGDANALFDLGVAFSTGSHGITCDMIEAHKWFNLAAVGGHEEAALCRSDIADEMTAREIAEAQRRAREWLRAGRAAA